MNRHRKVVIIMTNTNGMTYLEIFTNTDEGLSPENAPTELLDLLSNDSIVSQYQELKKNIQRIQNYMQSDMADELVHESPQSRIDDALTALSIFTELEKEATESGIEDSAINRMNEIIAQYDNDNKPTKPLKTIEPESLQLYHRMVADGHTPTAYSWHKYTHRNGIPTGRTCGFCTKFKRINEFYNKTNGTFGKQGICMDCQNEYNTAWNESNANITPTPEPTPTIEPEPSPETIIDLAVTPFNDVIEILVNDKGESSTDLKRLIIAVLSD